MCQKNPEICPKRKEDKKEWEIISLKWKSGIGGFIFKSNLPWSIGFTTCKTLEECLKKADNLEIYCVKRLSDGIDLKIGDNTDFGEINSFEVRKDGLMLVKSECCQKSLLQSVLCHHLKELDSVVLEKSLLFTTEDGVNIYQGDVFYTVNYKTFVLTNQKSIAISSINKEQAKINGYLWFSNKEKAEEYILMNKPCLSIKDIKDIGYGWKSPLQDLQEIIKSKSKLK